VKPGDLAWHLHHGDARLVMILEVGACVGGLPEWVQILTARGMQDWTTVSQLDVIDTSDATAG